MAKAERFLQSDLDPLLKRHDQSLSGKGSGYRLNLSFRDCPGLSFAGQSLTAADFSGANLRYCRFDRTDLSSANFFCADATSSSFRDASFRSAI